MIPEKLIEVLKHEGVVAIVTQGAKGAHVVNTWNSYLKITENGEFIGPVGGMNVTESNIQENHKVLVTIGSRNVQGFHSMGTGFLITGSARLVSNGDEFDKMKQVFPWARAAIAIKPESITQTL